MRIAPLVGRGRSRGRGRRRQGEKLRQDKAGRGGPRAWNALPGLPPNQRPPLTKASRSLSDTIKRLCVAVAPITLEEGNYVKQNMHNALV